MTSILILLLIVIGISFCCSLIEAVFLSITPAFINVKKKTNPRAGLLMESLKENVDRPIAAILSFNTIANTAGSAVIGAKVQSLLGNEWFTAFSVLLTISILLFSEFLPKVLGTIYWKSLAVPSAYAIRLFIFAVYPVVWLAERGSRLLKKNDDATVTRAEVLATAEIGATEGELHHKESAVIKNLLMLENIFVSDIMTPRSVMFALDAETTVIQVYEKYRPIRFSRIPVFDGSVDNVIGLTMRHRILEAMSSDHHHQKLREIISPIDSVSERLSVSAALDHFVKKKEHLALATDEYGVVTGLVTLEDAVETLLGVEIIDELDHVADMRQYALEQWQQRKKEFRRS
jgi:CBS domain containing-hemolysin-like protein